MSTKEQLLEEIENVENNQMIENDYTEWQKTSGRMKRLSPYLKKRKKLGKIPRYNIDGQLNNE